MMPGLILSDFKIFENVCCIGENYEKNVTAIKNRIIQMRFKSRLFGLHVFLALFKK